MTSSKQTRETPFIVQHGHCVRDTDVPNDDLQMCRVSKWPSEYWIDGYCSTKEEAESLAANRYLKEAVSNRYGLIFDISVGSKWDEGVEEFSEYDCVDVRDYWKEGLEAESKENVDIISKLILKVIDLDNGAHPSFVLLKALRECMTNTVVGNMTNRDEIVDFVYDKDNWNDEEAYEPENAMALLDAALRRAGYQAKDAFREEK